MKTLLQQAKSLGRLQRARKDYSPEEQELAIAWLKDEIGIEQLNRVTGRSGTNGYLFLARAIKRAYDEKKIKIR